MFFLLDITALIELNASSFAFDVALVPVSSVASAIILIGEQPNHLQWIGADARSNIILLCK